MSRKRLKRTLIILFITVFSIVALVILFISPITKYLIQKYDERYTGRQITLDWAYVNPFTGYVHLSNLKVYEYKSDTLFLSAGGLSADCSVRQLLFSKDFTLNSASLDHFYIRVVREHKKLNFQDIIDKLSAKDSSQPVTPKKKSSGHVNLGKMSIKDAEIHYTDRQTHFDYYIKKGDFATPGKQWDVDTMAFTYSFLSGPSAGSMKGKFDVNFKTSDYLLTDRIEGLDLKPMEQYIRDLANYGNLQAMLDADIFAKGNFHDADNIDAKGNVSLSGFHLGKTPGEDYMAFDKLRVVVTELSPVNNKYFFDSITLHRPYLKYERYDNSDNLETMFGKKGARVSSSKENPEKLNIIITIGQYIKALANNFFRSTYKLNNLDISRGDIDFNDFSLSEAFYTGLHSMNIRADSINKGRRRVNIYLKSGLQPYGNMNIQLSIDPKDSSYFDLVYHIENVPVSLFNPYTVTYTSFPLDRGTIAVNGAWHVLGGSINSNNHLVIVDPRATKRVRGKDKKWLPLPLIFAFIRERGDVIDYEIPITGNLKNPKFHWHDAIMHVLANIFVKPATTPYRFEVKNTEQVMEKLLMIKWPLMASTLLSSQEKYLGQTASFLASNPQASLVVQPFAYTMREKEYITFFEAKKKYFKEINHVNERDFSSDDSVAVARMAIRDSSFMRYLNARVKDKLLFTLQEKCTKLVGAGIIDAGLKRLYKNRLSVFMDYFKQEQVAGRVHVQNSKTTIPFDGFSYYELHYKGDIPPELQKAYDKMSQLNEEAPRKKYRKEHKQALRAK
ncbi:MAG: DUF748 domain-containing protein [Chitinophagaceae bacterium]